MKECELLIDDSIKEISKSNRVKDKIIILLIVLMFLESILFFCGFVWYESQFEYATTESVDLTTEGDNASAEYNDVEGNQYNDSSTHNEGGVE